VRAQGGVVSEANDFYREEERYWGQVATRNEEFGREIQAFVEAVKADGLELSDVATYVYAKHAQERNEHIAAQRGTMPDGGSGMLTADAQAILDDATNAGLDQALERHANTLYDWIAGTRNVMEQGGLITPQQAASWANQFDNYVPLRGLEGAPERKGTGSGFNIKGAEGKRAMGRKSEAKQIIEQIIQDRTRAYIRVGKNEVLRSFLNFALDNPSPNLWRIDAVETKAVAKVDALGNHVIEEEQRVTTDDRTVTVKDGGREIRILIEDRVLREQMQNMHIEGFGRVTGAMLWANRKVGAILTTYNPVFTVLNGARDFQAAMAGMAQEVGIGGALGFVGQYRKAFAQAVAAELGGSPSAGYLEFKRAGGTTGFVWSGDLQKTEAELVAMLRETDGINIPMRVLRGVMRLVENLNSVVENATRFAAYTAAKRSGLSVAESARVSKNITVNFNRKGTKAPWLSAWILFYNPAVQGTARLAQNMASPAAVSLIGTAAVSTFFLALLNAGLGGEDDDGVAFWDKVPNSVKERNLVVMLQPERQADGSLRARYIKVPLPYGYNVFKVTADQMADSFRRSSDPTAGRSAGESAALVAQATLNALQPINAVGQSVEDSGALTMLPFSNALGPVAQAAANRSSFGAPLYPDHPNEKNLPASSKYTAAQAGTIFQRAAQSMNEATGGSEYESGLIDIPPGVLENALRFYGGGIASFSLDLTNAFYARQHIERPTPDMTRLPFAKQLLGAIDNETDRWAGYDRLAKTEKAVQPYEQAKRDRDFDAAEAILGEKGPMALAGKRVRKVRAELSELRKEELSVITDKELSESEKFVRLLEISARVRQQLQFWNEAYDELLLETPTK
jgi:hypothetical protein